MSEDNKYQIYKFENTNSTNSLLAAIMRESKLNEFTVVTTREQTKGKGQAGNSWESEAGMNLTFSLLLKPNYIEAMEQFYISQAVALGIVGVLNSYTEGFSIKWPNDIYYHQKKIGGILIENTLSHTSIGSSIIGIGLNINQELFVSDAPNPISLKNITGDNYNIDKMLLSLLNSIANQISLIKNNDFELVKNNYMNQLFRHSGFHKYKDNSGEFDAEIIDITPFGHLVLNTKDNEQRTYAFKEVEFILS